MGPTPTYLPPKGEGCETPVEHWLPLWAEPNGGSCSRPAAPSLTWGSHFVGASDVGTLVGEPKPLVKTPFGDNPTSEMTYLQVQALQGYLGRHPSCASTSRATMKERPMFYAAFLQKSEKSYQCCVK